MTNMHCPFCLPIEPTLVVRFDKRGQPFCLCRACGARAFLRGLNQLGNLNFLAPTFASAAAVANDPAHPDHSAWRAEHARVLRHANGANAPTATSAADLAAMTPEGTHG